MGNKASSENNEPSSLTPPPSADAASKIMPETKKPASTAQFLDACHMTTADLRELAYPSTTAPAQRLAALQPVSRLDTCTVTTPVPMTAWEETSCVLLLALAPPNCVVTVPLVTIMLGVVTGSRISTMLTALLVILVSLTVLPQPFVVETLQSTMTTRLLRYFSYRCVLDDGQLPPSFVGPQLERIALDATHRPCILAAPPHGLFPYGNILAKFVWPSLTGHHFHGLAASAAVQLPIFKQYMRRIGIVDASRVAATHALQSWPHTVGISTGGVAEIFATNDVDHECVVLRERVGLIKLAIRVGADIRPCYLFGNTALLSCWTGEGLPGAQPLLKRWSRQVGFGLLLFWGRLGLPIPYRVPILAVFGQAIRTYDIMNDDPTMEQVRGIQHALINELRDIFDRYKGLYGWDNKRLIIR